MYIRFKRHIHALRMTAVAVLVITGILLGSVPTFADDLASLQSQSAAYAKKQQELMQEIYDQNSQLKTAQQKLDATNALVSNNQKQIDALNAQISLLNAQIDSNTKEIAATQKRMDDNRALYGQRLRAAYETGNYSGLSILLSAKDFTDFLARAETVQVVTQHDNSLFDAMKQDQAKLQADQAKLQAAKAGLVSSQGTLAAQETLLTAQKAQQSGLVAQIKSGLNSTQQEKNQVDQAKSETDAQINAEIAAEAAAERAKNPGGATASASYVISYAEGFQGVPYVFGCANPRYGFDCSGFTQYVFANAAGIALTHSALEQSHVGTPVAQSDLRPGDLVFFATDGGRTVSHVGIYIGNGAFIGANSSTGVAIVNNFFSISYWRNDYVCARRILN